MNVQEMSEQDRRDAIEERDALMAIRAVLVTPEGQTFFKYLIKTLDVGLLPEIGISGKMLADRLGFLRAGLSIWKLTAEANPQVAANLLAQIEKERYAELLANAQT